MRVLAIAGYFLLIKIVIQYVFTQTHSSDNLQSKNTGRLKFKFEMTSVILGIEHIAL